MAATEQIAESVPNDWSDFVHVGPGTLAGRYLCMFWQPVYIATELLPGNATTFRILGEDFTLYRGETGEPHLLQLRCAHRATQLNTGWVEGDEIRCFYHGWKYDAHGQCTEQPAELEPFADRVRLRSAVAIEYKGLIFGWFGRGAMPPVPFFPDLERDGAEHL